MDPLVSELGQALPLFEEQLEEVRGEASTALYVAQTQLLQPNGNTHMRTSIRPQSQRTQTHKT